MKTYQIMRNVCCVLGLALLGSWQVGALAAAESLDAGPRLELKSLVREVWENNPDIRAAQQRWEAAKAVIPQVKTLPDPLINLGYDKVEERAVTYGFSQEIPFPGKLQLRGEVATREAERLEQEYLAVPLRVIARLKEAFYDLPFVHASIEIVEKNRLVLVDFTKTAEARYAVGRGVQQDIFRAQTEVSRLLARLATLEQRMESLHAEINRLLNRPPADPLGTPQRLQVTPLQHNLAELNALIVHASPLLQAQYKSVERGDQSLALARREFLPDFAVSVGGVRNETLAKNGYQVMLGIKVPLYYATKQREAVREALASREAAVQEAHAVRQELLFRLKDNVTQVQRANKLIALLADAIIPQARLTLESAQAGHAVGKVDFLTLLSSLLTLQENELELHGEIVEHEKALARLEEVIGGAPWSQPPYPRLRVVAGVVAVEAMLILSPVIEQIWNACFLLSPTGVAAQHAPTGHNQAGTTRSGASGPKEPVAVESSLPKENMMTLSPERLQAVGVKFELAKRRFLDRMIRTVGQVEIDERRLSHVNIKLEGWIDELFVNSTGERVTKGQKLFTLYSPDLVATQTEYLLALKSHRTLGRNPFPEVAEGAESLVEVTRRRLHLWDITEDHVQDLERTGKVLRTLPIHAPQSGTVIKKVALAGMHVNPGDELYTIADLSHVWLLADIYEYELPFIKVGQTATVTLSYDPKAILQGRIAFLYPTIETQTRTAKVRFELGNPGERLKPGMYANVELKIPLGTRLVVPSDAILDSGERQLIFIHLGGGQLEWRTVKLGVRAGDWVEVLEGLKEDEHIVTSANFLLDSESQLKAAVSGMKGMQH